MYIFDYYRNKSLNDLIVIMAQNEGMLINQSTAYQPLPKDALQAKVIKWKEITKKKYSDKRKFGYQPIQKDLLPSEILRYHLHTEKSLRTIAT